MHDNNTRSMASIVVIFFYQAGTALAALLLGLTLTLPLSAVANDAASPTTYRERVLQGTTPNVVLREDIAVDADEYLLFEVEAGQQLTLEGEVWAAKPSAGIHDPFHVKRGAGTLVLAGENADGFNLLLQAGTLHLQNQDAFRLDARDEVFIWPNTTVKIDGGIVLNATLSLEHSEYVARYLPYANAVPLTTGVAYVEVPSGTVHMTGLTRVPVQQTLHKRGEGLLTLAEAAGMHMAGTLHVVEGGVSVHVHIGGLTVVHNHAFLQANSFYRAHIRQGGRLQARNPQHSIRIHKGSLRLDPGATLVLHLSDTSLPRPIEAVGSQIVLAGTLMVLFDEPYHWHQPVPLLWSDIGYEGRFDLLQTNLNVSTKLLYEDEWVSLVLAEAPYHPQLPLRPMYTGYLQLQQNLLEDSRFLREAVALYYAEQTPSSVLSHQVHSADAWWGHSFYADADYRGDSRRWQHNRRTGGVVLGWSSQATQHIRYGAQLLLQDSHWESEQAHSRAQWQSYWLAASVASPATQKVAWHAGVGVGVLPIQQQYRVGQDAVRSRYTRRQQQVYAQLRYPLWASAVGEQQSQLSAVLAGNYVRLSAASITERQHDTDTVKTALRVKAQARWQIGAGVQWQHRVQGAHATAQLQLQSMAYWVTHQQHARLQAGTQQRHHVMHHKHPVWQHSISLVAPSTKQGKITMQYGWQHGPRQNEHALRLGAEWRF